MNKQELKIKIEDKSKEELINIILSVYSSIGEVVPYYDNRKHYARIAPLETPQFRHGIAQANKFDNLDECKLFCNDLKEYLQEIVLCEIETED